MMLFCESDYDYIKELRQRARDVIQAEYRGYIKKDHLLPIMQLFMLRSINFKLEEIIEKLERSHEDRNVEESDLES